MAKYSAALRVCATFLRITESSRFWGFYERAGRPLYLAPTSKPRYRIDCETNGYEGEVSSEAAAIIATLFTFSHLSFRYNSNRFAEGYGRLHSYCAEHCEAADIFQAID